MVSTTFSFTSAILVLGLALMVSCQQEEVKPPAEEGPVLVNGEEVSTRPPLTGIPQIDYIWDPNLPHELNGYNLSSYPFYRRVPPPDKMEFECDGLHDGFYASVVHKCQVYHQCLFGLRYDFLCANFTAFDQKNFICHFANEVDCENSPKFFDRNEALYKTTSTTPLPTPPPIVVRTRFVDEEGRPVRRPGAGRFRRPNGKRRPVYYDDYYDYDYQEYYDAPAEEEDPSLARNSTTTSTAAKAEAPLIEEEVAAPAKPAKAGGGRQQRPGAGQGNRLNIFNNNRPPPRIRPPVPNSEAKKPNKPTKPTTTTPPPAEEFEYVDYVDGELPLEEVATTTTTTTTPSPPPKRRFRRPKTTTTPAPVIEEFVDDAFFEEEEFVEPATTTQRPRRPKVSGTRRQSTTEAATVTTTNTATTTTTKATTAPTVEEEPAPLELPSRRNSALFNRRTSVNNLLRRKSNNTVTSTTTLPDDILNEEEFVDEPVEEVVAEVTTTSTTTSTTSATPTRRTTKARPSRPANTARTRPTDAPIFVEEEAPVTTAPAVVEAKQAPLEVVESLPILEEAPLSVRGRVRRPQSPARVEEEAAAPVAPVTPPVNRRGSQRRGPQPPVIAEAEVEVAAEEDIVRQGRDLPESSRTVLEESTNFDEDLGESQQWSIINLFSRVYPYRA